MFNIIKLIFAILVIIAIGRSLLKLIIKDRNIPLSEQSALSFGLGVGALSIGMFLLSFIGLAINLPNILLLATPFLIYLIWDKKFKFGHIFDIENKMIDLNALQIILIIFILFITFLVFSDALIQPMTRWDERVVWGLKAKILYYDEGIYSKSFLDADIIHPHKNYPLLIPLIESWIYNVLGNVDDRLVKIIFPLFFISLLLIFYSSQRNFFSKTYSLIFTTFLASMPFIIVSPLPVPDAGSGAASGYADVPLSFFYFTATIYLYMWMTDTSKNNRLKISAIFSMFMIFTKTEGIILFFGNLSVFIIFILFNVQDRNIRNLSIFLSPTVLLIPWFIFQQNLPNDFIFQYSISRFVQNLYRLQPILIYFLKIFFNPLNWSVLWILFFLSTIFTIRFTSKKPIIYLFLIISFQLFAIILMYILTPYESVEFHIETSMNRMLMHIIPTITFLVSIQIFVGKLLPTVYDTKEIKN